MTNLILAADIGAHENAWCGAFERGGSAPRAGEWRAR
jgi:hypothetical protein